MDGSTGLNSCVKLTKKGGLREISPLGSKLPIYSFGVYSFLESEVS
jgi:hypothetical protein